MIKYRIAQEKDLVRINEFHNKIYSTERSLEQFYWQFQNGPFGKSIYIIGEDNDRIVGTNCVIPIEFVTSEGELFLTGKSEDTLVDPQYRGQNIFYDLYHVLFEKAKESNIKVIWGFTSAYKPFRKLGFSIPFMHGQSLLVNRPVSAYRYLSKLNPKNSLIDRVKIFLLCSYSWLNKLLLERNNQLHDIVVYKQEKSPGDVLNLLKGILKDQNGTYAIHLSSNFMKWRVEENPYYNKVQTFYFYNEQEALIGYLGFNISNDNVAYVIHEMFNPEISSLLVARMINYCGNELFLDGVSMIRNWSFNHNEMNFNNIRYFKLAKYMMLRKGIGFVWKELADGCPDSKGFFLSRIATQGNN